jgi:hypothetical protein
MNEVIIRDGGGVELSFRRKLKMKMNVDGR